MDILDVLIKAMATREVETGKKATALYLGSLQWDNLIVWAADNYGYAYDRQGIDVPEFHGCKVYRVHVEDHVCAV